MGLNNFAGTVTPAALNANFDDKTASLKASARAGRRDFQIDVERFDLAAADDVSVRSFDFIPEDDYELRALGVSVADEIDGAQVWVHLSSPDDDEFLLEQDVRLRVVQVAGVLTHARADYRTTTGVRLKLLKGVRYRLELIGDPGGVVSDRAYAWALLRAKRRAA